jgi:hypothetical protein
MTEEEWLQATSPHAMLTFLGDKAGLRKLRLFACGCCRQIWHLLRDERTQMAVEVAERFADGRATAKERAKADRDNAWVWTENEGSLRDYRLATAVGWCISVGNRRDGPRTPVILQLSLFLNDALPFAAQAAIFRDIFGNPFRPVAIDPAWLTWHESTIPRMAQAIYNERAFDHLPILADALEEAGCNDAELLGHLRGNGPHTKGCWAVDAILGKN